MNTVTKCLWCGSKELEPFAHRKDGIGIIKCRQCKLVMVEKIPKNLDEYYYQESYFNAGEDNVDTGYAETYDLMAPAFLFWQNSLIEEVNEGHNKKSFLEIGSATGNLLEIIRENQDNLTLEGMDVSEYAVETTRSKGFKATVAHIEDFKSNPKLDIIFSSETMEHLDNLKSFLGGVAKNLKENGTFLFYVPSISEEDARKEDNKYLRFTSNLEHLLHFTPEFFNKELPQFFEATVLIKEFKTGFGPCIVGAVSKDKDNLKQLEKLFDALSTNTVPAKATDIFLKNLVVIALKFAQFDLANKALEEIQKQGTLNKNDLLLLNGLMGYHNGEILKSTKAFESYLMANPGNRFTIKSLLANSREYNRLLEDEVGRLRRRIESDLEPRVLKAETLVNDIKKSKVLGSLILARKAVRKARILLKKLKKKVRSKLIRIFRRLVPLRVRRIAKYIITREWRRRYTVIENPIYVDGQPIVSVVIPFYNRTSTIDETLASLRIQSFNSFEVIIVNDGSTEPESNEKLKHLNLTGLSAQVVSQENQGVAVARNLGVSLARGKYIVCLDSDDVLTSTYIEKCLVLLETNPNIALATTDEKFFGVQNHIWKQADYDPHHLFENNMVTTAAMFEKEGWEKTGGYRSGIGYEDWEFWIHLAENGYWGKNIPEPLFNYRTALSSRFIEDSANGRENIEKIHKLHPGYFHNLKKVAKQKSFLIENITRNSLFVNLDNPSAYTLPDNGLPNILITIPWMAFGGAETLIYNYCIEIRDKFNISFITGLKSEHEWEYKFQEITPNIYHLDNLFDDRDIYLEFVSNYIKTRQINVLHIIHNGFTFEMLSELRKRHPELKVVVTMFNSRVEYFEQSIKYDKYIDAYVTDNAFVASEYRKKVEPSKPVTVIANGVDCYDTFNLALYNRPRERAVLDINEENIAVYFIGRLSIEKNPDVFLEVARKFLSNTNEKRLRFFVVGDGPMKPRVERAIKSLRSEYITYLGYQAEVAKCLSSADIFVLPSSIEGFPLSILEAMAMKVVVIASDVGAVSDVIQSGEDGFVVTPGSAKEIIAVIEGLLVNPQLLKTAKEQARKKVEKKYSNTILGHNYEEMYKGLLS